MNFVDPVKRVVLTFGEMPVAIEMTAITVFIQWYDVSLHKYGQRHHLLVLPPPPKSHYLICTCGHARTGTCQHRLTRTHTEGHAHTAHTDRECTRAHTARTH